MDEKELITPESTDNVSSGESFNAGEFTPMPGLTATMEIAGAESIPGANPDKIILGFARED